MSAAQKWLINQCDWWFWAHTLAPYDVTTGLTTLTCSDAGSCDEDVAASVGIEPRWIHSGRHTTSGMFVI